MLIHLVRTFISQADNFWLTLAFAFNPARIAPPPALRGFEFPGALAGDIWTFFTHALLHGDWLHLVLNSVWMLVFGSLIAVRLGAVRFLVFSALCAAAGAAANLVVYWGNHAMLVGASGAISGQMAAAIRLMFAGRGQLWDINRQLEAPGPALSLAGVFLNRRALTFIAVWIVVNMIFGLTNLGLSQDAGRIAWEAHLGGFFAGLVLFGWFDRKTMR